VVLDSYVARFHAEAGCSPDRWLVAELRDSQEPCTVPLRGWLLLRHAR
jgi:hypothetical protein